MKMVLIRGVNTVYRWICLKIFLIIQCESSLMEEYIDMEQAECPTV